MKLSLSLSFGFGEISHCWFLFRGLVFIDGLLSWLVWGFRSSYWLIGRDLLRLLIVFVVSHRPFLLRSLKLGLSPYLLSCFTSLDLLFSLF